MPTANGDIGGPNDSPNRPAAPRRRKQQVEA